MIAIVQAYKKGFLAKRFFIKNLIAGLVVGIIALPLAMAFAIASGAKPEQGIYTAIVAGMTVSILGGSRVQIAGPTGAFIVVLAGITAEHGIIGLQIATLMAGIILIAFGLLRLGGIIKFIPTPVILGFTAGIGVVIWISQWPSFLGIPPPQQAFFHEKLAAMFSQFTDIDAMTLVFGMISLAILLIIPKIKAIKWLPASLLVLVISTTLQAMFQFPTVATIGSSFGGIKQGLPEIIIPTFNFVTFTSLIGPAFAIAMLGAIESLLSATVADNMTKSKHHPNQELIGQGIANMLAPIFGGFAATGAIARTAANIKNGGSSPVAGIVHGLFLLSVLVFMAPLATHIPLSSLAAILFVVA
ncbi:SulP family inorganic anion transporter [Thorsellia anophelis]|uniref:Sulfate permease family protein n=1 Tax=Thorsellia anophelis DSM 18579 TaxID=1123402 RepID=A0A1H9ZYN4_9GAMM|nr:SulP family inorganic anion transporter [Thorsellia anophelis]SES86875.1 Sulfate permease family protein [Thorsellia anophelis DSM 18579]